MRKFKFLKDLPEAYRPSLAGMATELLEIDHSLRFTLRVGSEVQIGKHPKRVSEQGMSILRGSAQVGSLVYTSEGTLIASASHYLFKMDVQNPHEFEVYWGRFVEEVKLKLEALKLARQKRKAGRLIKLEQWERDLGVRLPQ